MHFPFPAPRMPAAIAGLAMLASAPALAVSHEAQLWLTLGTEAIVSGALRAQYEGQARLGAQRDGLYQYQHRFGLAYRATSRATLGLGGQVSNVIRNNRSEPAERRIIGQFDYVLANPPGRRLVSRTRIERRNLDGSSDTGWRARQRLGLDFALPPEGATLVTHVEAMFNLNDTDVGPPSGFDRTRAYAGASFPIARIATCAASGPSGSPCGPLTVRLEAGYMNQWRVQRAREDGMDHIALLSLTIRP